MTAVPRAVGTNQLPVPKELSYTRPQHCTLTNTGINDGLLLLDTPRAADVLFALETGLDGVGVGSPDASDACGRARAHARSSRQLLRSASRRRCRVPSRCSTCFGKRTRTKFRSHFSSWTRTCSTTADWFRARSRKATKNLAFV